MHRPFVKVNHAAIRTELLENELFGQERGAYTAAEGTLLLLLKTRSSSV